MTDLFRPQENCCTVCRATPTVFPTRTFWSVGDLVYCEQCVPPDLKAMYEAHAAAAPSQPTKGVKDDAGKAPWDLLPWHAVDQVVQVLEFGRLTYDSENWRGVKGARRRYFSATMRHVWAWWRGESHDPESGLHHLAHAACCVLFMLDLELGVGMPYRDEDGCWRPNVRPTQPPALGPAAVETALRKKAKRKAA